MVTQQDCKYINDLDDRLSRYESLSYDDVRRLVEILNSLDEKYTYVMASKIIELLMDKSDGLLGKILKNIKETIDKEGENNDKT